MKCCSVCKLDRPAGDFLADKRANDGLQSACKPCSNKRRRLRRKDPVVQADFRAENARSSREFRKNNPGYNTWYAEWKRKRFEEKPILRVIGRIRTRTKNAIKRAGAGKSSASLVLLGCDADTLRVHLESKFHPHPLTGEKMSWSNYSFLGWHVDHIRPIDSFDISDPEQQRQAFHYTNLQPLWAKDNLSKGSRW